MSKKNSTIQSYFTMSKQTLRSDKNLRPHQNVAYIKIIRTCVVMQLYSDNSLITKIFHILMRVSIIIMDYILRHLAYMGL